MDIVIEDSSLSRGVRITKLQGNNCKMLSTMCGIEEKKWIWRWINLFFIGPLSDGQRGTFKVIKLTFFVRCRWRLSSDKINKFFYKDSKEFWVQKKFQGVKHSGECWKLSKNFNFASCISENILKNSPEFFPPPMHLKFIFCYFSPHFSIIHYSNNKNTAAHK